MARGIYDNKPFPGFMKTDHDPKYDRMKRPVTPNSQSGLVPSTDMFPVCTSCLEHTGSKHPAKLADVNWKLARRMSSARPDGSVHASCETHIEPPTAFQDSLRLRGHANKDLPTSDIDYSRNSNRVSSCRDDNGLNSDDITNFLYQEDVQGEHSVGVNTPYAGGGTGGRRLEGENASQYCHRIMIKEIWETLDLIKAGEVDGEICSLMDHPRAKRGQGVQTETEDADTLMEG